MDTQKRELSALDSVQGADGERLEKEFAEAFGNRVRILRGTTSRPDFAGALGVHPNTVGKFERGETMPDALLIARMCELGRRTPQWLITGKSSDNYTPDRNLVAVEAGEFLWVPLFDINASAGDGALTDIERVTAMRPFDMGFIRSDLGIQHLELAMCGIIGDSAAPRLNSRDTVLIDRRDRDVHTEGMHVVRLDGALLAKRLQRLPGRILRVSSQNEDYAPFEISGSEEAERDFAVIGRVRWGGVIFN